MSHKVYYPQHTFGDTKPKKPYNISILYQKALTISDRRQVLHHTNTNKAL